MLSVWGSEVVTTAHHPFWEVTVRLEGRHHPESGEQLAAPVAVGSPVGAVQSSDPSSGPTFAEKMDASGKCYISRGTR